MAPLTTSQLDHGDGVWSSVRLTPSPAGTRVERYGWDTESLRPYSNYRRLLRERLDTTNDPAARTNEVVLTAGGTFLSLDGDIRNAIYRMILVPAPGYIDYAPKTTLYRAGNHKARKRHLRQFREDILPGLHLLRLNKQIRAEAASLFYGENEFRFTNVKAWYVLDTWLRQIGPYHQSLVRKITVHVPWEGDLLDDLVDARPESNTRLDRIHTGLQNMGMNPRTNRNLFCQVRCVRRTAILLEQHGKLVQFRLILPDSFVLSTPWPYVPDSQYDFILDPARFDSLRMQLVRLHGGFEGEYNRWTNRWTHGIQGWLTDIQNRRAKALVSHLPARRQALGWGFECLDMVYDRHGHYPVPLARGDAILDITELA